MKKEKVFKETELKKGFLTQNMKEAMEILGFGIHHRFGLPSTHCDTNLGITATDPMVSPMLCSTTSDSIGEAAQATSSGLFNCAQNTQKIFKIKEVENAMKEEIRCGKIKKHQVQLIASKMHGYVHGVFVEQQSRAEPPPLDYIMGLMFERWSNEVLLIDPTVDGFVEIIKILEDDDVGLRRLAYQIKSNQNKEKQRE